MSYEIEYRNFAVKFDLTNVREKWAKQGFTGGRGNTLYMIFSEVGSSNVWTAERGRARDWYCVASGTEEDIIAHAERLAPAVADGEIHYRRAGNRITGKGYVRAYKKLVANAMPVLLEMPEPVHGLIEIPCGHVEMNNMALPFHYKDANAKVKGHPLNQKILSDAEVDTVVTIVEREAPQFEAVLAWALDSVCGSAALGNLHYGTASRYWAEEAHETQVLINRGLMKIAA